MTERLGSARIEELTNPAIRSDAAAALARELGVESLLIFVSDVESGALLPAPGFPQTMPDGRRWREFLAECMRSVRASASLPTPPTGAIQSVLGLARGNAVLALIGGSPRQSDAESLLEVLPLLGAALRNERTAQAAFARAALASSTAEQARAMTAALDGTRRELQHALAEVQRVRSDLEGALALRDDFVSVASHELRNPIGALQLQIRALLIAVNTPREVATREWIEERLQGAGRQVARLVKLVDSLLDVSRMTAMRISLELEDTDIAAVTREAVERLQEAAEVPIAVRAPDSLVGRWDRFRLDQVVTNLVSNALKYGQNKPVSVDLERRGDVARLRVEDRGIGIPAESQKRVFERFERAVSGRDFAGLGLGLWISREIVEALGGGISVESAPGSGSAFTVTLPIEGPAAGGDAPANG
ncbi:MAG: HAMP domain-containing histidine kinase [Acidobacteria bacterium]|nr:HAMP domain-containing histidine kinase [Acidobacteriota bacterium]